MAPKVKTVAIVGSHVDTRADVFNNNKSVDVWVFNEAAQAEWCKRVSAVFQLHVPEIYTSPYNATNAGHWDWLQKPHDFPVYMQARDERVPASVEYPLTAICEKYLAGLKYMDPDTRKLEQARLFSSSHAYALALALYQGYKRILIYGIELSSNTEYAAQHPGFLFWLGLATGTGVEVECYSGQWMLTKPLYGYTGEVTLGREYFTAEADRAAHQWESAEKHLGRVIKTLEQHIERDDYEKAARMVDMLRDAATASGHKEAERAQAAHYAEYGDRAIYRNEFEINAATARANGEEQRNRTLIECGKAEYVWNVWRQTKRPEARMQFQTYMKNIAQMAYDTGIQLGRWQANEQYMSALDDRIHAAGGSKSVQVLTR